MGWLEGAPLLLVWGGLLRQVGSSVKDGRVSLGRDSLGCEARG